MSYFDDNEDRIIYGRNRSMQRRASGSARQHAEKRARAALAALPGSDLARARIAAHAAFDPLWQSGKFSRGVAYEWLAAELGIPVDSCHMVLFDVAQCQRVVAICEAHPAAVAARAADFDVLD